MARRRYAGRRQKSTGSKAPVVIFAVIVLFATAAGLMGAKIAENVIAPVLRYFGIYSSSPSASPGKNETKVDMHGLSVWYLQTGAFKSRENAEKGADEASVLGGAGYIIDDNGRYRVILQPYADEASAKAVKTRLKNDNGIDTSVHAVLTANATLTIDCTAKQGTALKESSILITEGLELLMQASANGEISTAKEGIGKAKEKFDAASSTITGAFADPEAGSVEGKLLGIASACSKACEEADAADGSDPMITLRYEVCQQCNAYQTLLTDK